MKIRCYVSGKKAILAIAGIAVIVSCFLGACCVRAVCSDAKGVSVPILMYHSVGYNNKIQSPYLISPEVFEEDLHWLRSGGYTAVFVSDLIAYVDGTGTLPEKPVVISLDDGFLNNRTYVLPLLEKYNMKAVLSVVGSFCEQYTRHPDPNPSYAYLTWSDVADLAETGYFEISNHTYAMHTMGERTGCMRRADESVASYSAALSSDLSLLQSMLSQTTGRTPTVFAYPYGAVSDEAVFVLQALGFRAALTCVEQVNFLTPGASESLYHLGRFNRPSGERTKDFMERVFS